MLVWTVTGQTDAGMDSYWIEDAGMDSYWTDWYRYGQLLDRVMLVWIITGQTDASMDSYWID